MNTGRAALELRRGIGWLKASRTHQAVLIVVLTAVLGASLAFAARAERRATTATTRTAASSTQTRDARQNDKSEKQVSDRKPGDGTPAKNGQTAVPAPEDSPASPAICANQNGAQPPRGMWVWQYAAATDAKQQAELLQFAGTHRVQTIYLESEKLIASNQAELAALLQEAKRQCISVELLFGAADWAFTPNHAYAVSLAEKAAAFAAGTPVPPAGVHYDVEPYNLPEYKANPNAGANQYLDMLEKIQAVIKPSGMYFANAMPLGFEFQTVTRGGASMPLSYATIDRVDRVVLMDYRDSAERVTNDARSEIDYAAAKGKQLVVGLETSCETGEVETITFCEEGSAYMEAQLAKVHEAFSGNAAYAGLAVHDYSAYKTLAP